MTKEEEMSIVFSLIADSAEFVNICGESTSTHPVRLTYQPPANSTFISEQISHQQPASSTSLSEQTSTSHQPPAKRTDCGW
jgi:hypothetical protein